MTLRIATGFGYPYSTLVAVAGTLPFTNSLAFTNSLGQVEFCDKHD